MISKGYKQNKEFFHAMIILSGGDMVTISELCDVCVMAGLTNCKYRCKKSCCLTSVSLL